MSENAMRALLLNLMGARHDEAGRLALQKDADHDR